MRNLKRTLALIVVAIVTLSVSAQSLKEQFKSMVEAVPATNEDGTYSHGFTGEEFIKLSKK